MSIGAPIGSAIGSAIGSGMAGGGAAPAFDPLTLYSGGKKGFWIKPRDWTTLRQWYLGTTNVTAATDPVGYAADQSGNTTNAVNASAPGRPVAATVGAVDCIDLDGVDDKLLTGTVVAGTWATMDFFIVLNLDAAASFLLGDDDDGRGFGIGQNGAGTSPSFGAGSPSYAVNGVAVPGGTSATRAQLYDAMGFTAWKVVEVHGADLSLWTKLQFGAYSGFQLNGKVAEVILCESQPASRAAIRTYLGAQVGLTL